MSAPEEAMVVIGVVALVLLPIIHVACAIKRKRYRDHGNRTGEW